MSDRPFREAKCGKWTAEPSASGSVIEDLCKEPVLYIEHESGSRSKYRESDVRDLRAMLDDALADALPAPPPDDDLVPILDAVRERRFGDAIRAIVLHHCDEHTAEVVGALYTACVERFPEECAIVAAETVSVQRAGYMPCGECEGQTVLVTCGDVCWRQCLEQCSRTSRRQPAIGSISAVDPDGGINFAALEVTPPPPPPPPPTGGKRAMQRVGRESQEAARRRGINCQSCDGGFVQCRNPVSGGRFLRTCRYCAGTGVRV